MLFNLFGKKENTDENATFKDLVYISSEGKLNACIALAKEQPETIFICWFPETAEKFKQAFTENGIEESRIMEAHHAHAGKIGNNPVVFLEHHPLHEKEAALVNNWQKTNMPVYSALDEPLFKHFGSDKVIPMVKMLGMKEDEAIQHSMVSKSIATSQQKIAEKVQIEKSAASQADWIEKNLS